MSLDTQAVVDLVAKEHGIFLSQNDPLLSVLAINDVVLSSYASDLANQLSDVKEHLETVTVRHQQQSKEIAQTIVGQTLEKIQQSGHDLQHDLLSALSEERRLNVVEMKSLLAESQKMRHQTYLATIISLACVLITVSALVLYGMS